MDTLREWCDCGSFDCESFELGLRHGSDHTNKSIQETLTNSGGTTVTSAQISATGAYSVTGATLPITLAAGASTAFQRSVCSDHKRSSEFDR